MSLNDARYSISKKLAVLSTSLDSLITNDYVMSKNWDVPLREAQEIVENVRDKISERETVAR